MREAAKLIGIPETTYREWEYGRQIRGEPYVKIADAFGISLDELFGVERTASQPVDKEIDKIIHNLQTIKTKLHR